MHLEIFYLYLFSSPGFSPPGLQTSDDSLRFKNVNRNQILLSPSCEEGSEREEGELDSLEEVRFDPKNLNKKSLDPMFVL